MDPRTQPLRDEHRALLPELASVRAAADAVGTAAASEQLERAHRLLVRHLIPHMIAEEAVLYPAIDRLAGSSATTTLRRDHDEIRRRIAQLDNKLSGADTDHDSEVRAALYGLDAIVRLHLAKEEELYFPLLDRHLDDQGATEIVAAMHEVERDRYQHAKPEGNGP